MVLTRADVVRHCGGERVRRAEVLCDQVCDLVMQDDALEARVGEEPGYVLSVHWGTRLVSECSCLLGGRCVHVAAALLVACVGESSAAVERGAKPAGVAPDDLRDWVESHLPRVLHTHGLATLMPWFRPRHHSVGSWWRGWSDELNLGAFLDDVLMGRVPLRAQEEIGAALPEVLTRWQAASAYVRDAEAWRASPPEESSLVPLWRAAMDWVPKQPLYVVHRAAAWPAHRFSGLSREGEVPMVVCGVGGRRQLHPLMNARGELELDSMGGAAASFAGWFLDVFLRLPADAPERVALAAALGTPQWARQLAAIDVLLDDAQATSTVPALQVGWRLGTTRTPWTLEPVSLVPYATKPGFRTKRLRVSSIDVDTLEDTRDRAAVVELSRTRGSLGVHRALRHLVGHPRAVDASGRSISVGVGTLSLSILDDGGDFLLSPRIAGLSVPSSDWPGLLSSWEDGVFAWVDPTGRRVWVGSPGREVLGLLRNLVSYGSRFPADARDALVDRLDRLERILPLELDPSLRGTRRELDERVIVRLDSLGEGGLRVVFRVRPLRGGPTLRPGHGATELARIGVDGRVFVRRQLESETRRVLRLASHLGVVPDGEWEVLLWDVEQALHVVERLQDCGTHVVVEWATRQRWVAPSPEPGGLSVRCVTRRDWFGLDGELPAGASVIPLGQVLDVIRRRGRFVRVDDEHWIAISDTLRQALEPAARLDEEALGELAALRLAESLGQAGLAVDLPLTLVPARERIAEAAQLEVPLPDGLLATLRPYQREGFTWLARMAHWSRGACLADDMGLGKTVQSLALLCHRAPGGAALVVAPASVLTNWQREAERFAPSLRVQLYGGRRRHALLEDLGPHDVLVCSYEVVARDRAALSDAAFHTVVLDEAQAIKNPASQRARAVAELRAGFHLALSGTPVENRVGELWSLFRVIAPGLLGTARRFTERFVRPIEVDGDEGARHALARLISPFLLRRLKRDVATELPERQERLVYVTLAKDERRAYEVVRASAVAALRDEDAGRMNVLAALTRLRQLACARKLVDPQAPATSTKIERLLVWLERVRDAGEHALVFSQFVSLLQLVRDALPSHGLTARYLDGAMSRGRRQSEIDAFQQGQADVMLVSLHAGGTGLNLTRASWVFHLDPWWNPAKEDQATDRAHRIGQTRAVQVVRLVAADTIEERVLALHRDKRALAGALLGEAGRVSALTAQDIYALLRDEVDAGAAPGGEAGVMAAPAGRASSSHRLDGAEGGPAWAVHDAWVAKYVAWVDAAQHRGEGAISSIRDEVRAIEALATYVESEGARLDTPTDVATWGERYLEELRAAGMSEAVGVRHGPAAFAKLQQLMRS